MNKYWVISKLYAKSQVNFRSKLFGTFTSFTLRLAVLIAIYSYAFDYAGGDINQVSFAIAAWSLAVYFVLMYSGSRSTAKTLSDDIKNGIIETKINKPLNFASLKVFENFGSAIPNLVSLAVLSLIIVTAIAGFPEYQATVLKTAGTFGVFVLGLILSYLIYVTISLSAFWIEESTPVFWITDKFIMVLGGSYVPVALFPGTLKAFAEVSPFGATLFITQMWTLEFESLIIYFLLTQIIWIVSFYIILNYLYSKAVKKLSVNGG